MHIRALSRNARAAARAMARAGLNWTHHRGGQETGDNRHNSTVSRQQKADIDFYVGRVESLCGEGGDFG
jgi:hypothetical protein